MGETVLRMSFKKLSIYIISAALAGIALLTVTSCSQKKECETHKAGSWSVSKAATCEEAGVSVRRCTVCDEIVEFRNDEALGHNAGSWEVQTAPTCTEDGVMVRKCTRCSIVIEQTESAATGHFPGEFVVSVAPTCTENGEEVRKCTSCSEILETKEIAKLNHNADTWTQTKAPSCIADGEKARICKNCNQHIETQVVPSAGHNAGEWEITKAATCTESGTRQKTCIGCSLVMETGTVEAKGHTKGSWRIVKEATCTETGTSQRKCTVCEEIIGTQTLEAKGHTDGKWIVDQEPTCTNEGERHMECKVCKESIRTEEIEATGHTVGEWIVDKEPTCTEKGKRHNVCTVCERTVKTEDIDATGHTVGEWIVDKEPNCTEKGKRHNVCTVCTVTVDTEEIDALGHTAGEWIEKSPASCEKEGERFALCTVCNEIAKEEKIKKLPHDYSNDVCTVCGVERYSEGLEYELRDDGYYVVGMGECTDTRLIIPAKHNDTPVVGVADGAFGSNNKITELVFRGSVKSIGFSAFNGCTSLISVDFKGDVESIGRLAFGECPIEKIEFKASLKSIGDAAFTSLKVKELVLPEGIEIGGSCFEKSAVERVVLPKEFTAGNEIFKNCKSLKSVVFNGDSINVASSMFQYCTVLESVTFGGNIEKIGQNAFYGCTSLSFDKLELSCAVGMNAFDSVTINELTISVKTVSGLEGSKIGKLTLSEGVEVIGENALYRTKVDSIVLPESLKTVETHAFYAATVKNAEFKSAVAVGFGAFMDCKSLVSVTLPKGSTVDDYAFSDCESLETIYFGGTKQEWTVIVENYGYTATDRKDFDGVNVICADGEADDSYDDSIVSEYDVYGAPGWYLDSETNDAVANGVIHVEKTFVDDDEKKYKVNILVVDPSLASFAMGSSDDGYDYSLTASKRQNTKQHLIAAAANGANVVAGVNADFFYINGDYHPQGLAIKNGTVITKGEANRPYFAVTGQGKAVIGASGTTANTEELLMAVGGSHIILENGQIKDVDMKDSFGYTAHPRTVVGIKENGTVILAVIDGRQSALSNGASLEKCAELMRSLGAETAINLDGGGSSTMVVLDDGEYTVKNSPSDGKLRNVYNSLLVIAK